MTLRDIRPAAELARLDACTSPRRRAPSAIAATAIHRTKGGTLLRVEISSYPLEFDGREARMVLVQDMTEQLAAAEALRRSEQKLPHAHRAAAGRLLPHRRAGAVEPPQPRMDDPHRACGGRRASARTS